MLIKKIAAWTALIASIAGIVTAAKSFLIDNNKDTKLPSTQVSTAQNSPNVSSVSGNVSINIQNGNSINTPEKVVTTKLKTKELYYGSRLGMFTNVVSESGLNTERAVIRVIHPEENLSVYCREHAKSVYSECVKGAGKLGISMYVAANCETGLFSDLHSRLYKFEGPNPRRNDPLELAKYLIIEESNGRQLDGTSASGYPITIEVFHALCPDRAPKF